MTREDTQLGDTVEAIRDVKTKNRIMKAGTRGRIVQRWPCLVGVRPFTKRLWVEGSYESFKLVREV